MSKRNNASVPRLLAEIVAIPQTSTQDKSHLLSTELIHETNFIMM